MNGLSVKGGPANKSSNKQYMPKPSPNIYKEIYHLAQNNQQANEINYILKLTQTITKKTPQSSQNLSYIFQIKHPIFHQIYF